jgi:uncharacterized protein (TIGR03435 family)
MIRRVLTANLLVGLACGQSAPAPLTFEVASIKPSSERADRRMLRFMPGGGLQVSGMTLKSLITFAYDVRDFQITVGPGWINSEPFDIEAKSDRNTSDNATPDEMRNMTDAQMKTTAEQMRLKLQALLADRFQLTLHHETKEQPVYALVIGKNGSKLQESQMKAGERRRMMRMGRSELNAEGVAIDMLTHTLSNVLGRPVIDRTGLKGNYDFKLQWTPDPGQSGGLGGPPPPGVEAPPPPDPNGPSIFTAVQEQLGLRLESQKGPVDLIVIDRVEKLSDN